MSKRPRNAIEEDEEEEEDLIAEMAPPSTHAPRSPLPHPSGPDDVLQHGDGPLLYIENGFDDIAGLLLSAQHPPASSSALLAHVVAAPVGPRQRFQFDPADKVKETTLKRDVRARANREPAFADILVRWFEAWTHHRQDSNSDGEVLEDDASNFLDIFQCLWPYYTENVTPTPETRIALGVVGLMAGLATVSPQVLALLARAPKRPNCEFHMVNALMSVIKFTVKSTPKDERAAVHLLKQTLKKVASFSTAVPDMGQQPSAPFPTLAIFVRSFIDLLACTPRLVADFFCAGVDVTKSLDDEDSDHRFGYRLYGDLADALRVAPDEVDTLDEILRQFESEHLNPSGDHDAPAFCNAGHAFDQREYYYSYKSRGPPPMLIFEATARQGIPRACLVSHVTLTECTLQGTLASEHAYALVAVVVVHGAEDDLSLEFYAPGTPYNVNGDHLPNDHAAIALVIYARLAEHTERAASHLLARLRSAERGESGPMFDEDEEEVDEEAGEEREEEEEGDGDDDDDDDDMVDSIADE